MNNTKNEHVFSFPRRAFSEAESASGLWIGMAYSSFSPSRNAFPHIKRRRLDYYSISHLYSGGGKIEMGSEPERILHPGDCIVITPQVVHRYGSYDEYQFLEDSVKFAGPVADMLFKAGIIKAGIYSLGTTRLLKPIIELLASSSVKKRLQANLILQEVLMKIYLNEDNPETSPLDQLLEMIRTSLDKHWTLDEMAELCQMSKNHLRRVFLKITGMTPKAYVDQQKINLACTLLLSTKLSIVAVSEQLGWDNPYHFSRRFKSITGISPLEYRKHAILPPETSRFSKS